MSLSDAGNPVSIGTVLGKPGTKRQKAWRSGLAVLFCGSWLMAAEPGLRTKPIDVPAPAPDWDNFTVLDPAAFRQQGGFVPTKELSLILNHALDVGHPIPADIPQWIKFQMRYALNGTIEFWRQGLDDDHGNLKEPITSDSLSALTNSVKGLRLATKQDIVAWIAALHKYDAWSETARSKDVGDAVKEIGRSPRHIFTFVVKEHQPYLRVTIISTVESTLRGEPACFTGGAETWDFQQNEIHLFEFFMSKIKGIQEKMAAAQKADPFQ